MRILILFTVLTVAVVFSAVLRTAVPAGPAPVASRNRKLSVFGYGSHLPAPAAPPATPDTRCIECCSEIHQSRISHIIGIVMVIYLFIGVVYALVLLKCTFWDLPESVEARVPLEEPAQRSADGAAPAAASPPVSAPPAVAPPVAAPPVAAPPVAAPPVAAPPVAAPPTRLATLLDVHIADLNRRIDTMSRYDVVRRLTQAAEHYYIVMKAIGAPVVLGYIILRIVWPAFTIFKWANPWDAELEAINRIH